MAFFSRKSKAVTPAVKSAGVELVAPDSVTENEVRAVIQKARNLPPEKLWETQHNVRVAVDFLARNVAQLGLHVYANNGDKGRERVRDSVVAKVLRAPNPQHTGYELVEALVSDLALFSEAWWWVSQTKDGFQIIPLPVQDVQVDSGRELLGTLVLRYSAGSSPVLIKQEDLIHFRSWHPDYSTNVSPAVTALRDVLAEQIAAQAFRAKVWQNGGQVSQYIHRPKDAPEWSSEAEAGFKEAIGQWRSGGGGEGGWPLLADGMEIRSARLNAKEEQWAESYQLALETCARAWHIQPSMLGSTGGISYANLREFRKMLYGETLGPIIEMIQDRLNRFLLPMLGEPDNHYVEFNTKQRMSASFDEQAAAYSSAVGRPYMTADEIRAIENMPALGGDASELVTPLNVLVGGQASARDSGSQNVRAGDAPRVKALSRAPGGPLRVKADGRPEDAKLCEQVLQKFFKRQGTAVLARLGSKSAAWWDQERWDRELADDLFKAAFTVSTEVAQETLESLGIAPSVYDEARTAAFLKALAGKRAQWINDATYRQLQAALDDDLSDDAVKATPEGVFEEAEGSRAESAGLTLATTLAGFAVVESLKQSGRPGTTKTWLTTSGDPRPSHAVMDGETVAVDEVFSNGMDWPGDMVGAGGDGGEIANCSCVTELTIY